MLFFVLSFLVSEKIKQDIADQLHYQDSRNASRKQHCCILSDTISSGGNTENFNEDVAAQTPVNETDESNDNKDQQLATKEIVKLKKKTKLLKNKFLKMKI